ncbi:MAG: glycosyltransferase family 2 protein [Pseudomonadota bacterium]
MNAQNNETSPRVAVVVITHNGRHHLDECLTALRAQTQGGFRTLLIDNASTDGAAEHVRARFPWVEVLRNDENLGFAGGYNAAIAGLDADYVALLNDDTRPEPGWLAELVQALSRDPNLFAVGSRILLHDDPSRLNAAGGRITLVGAGIDIGLGQPDGAEYQRPGPVGTLCGAAMLVRRSVFEDLGGFDPDYFAYCEDVDLCWRAWLRGYTVEYVPTSVVLHKLGGTFGGRRSPLRIRLGQRNRLRTMLKNLGPLDLAVAVAVSGVYDLVRIGWWLRRGDREFVRALLQGNGEVLRELGALRRKRAEIQTHRVRTDRDLRRRGVVMGLGEAILEYVRLERKRRK